MRYLACLALSLCLSTTAWSGDPEAGKAKSRSCATCHGTEGISSLPINPNLKGQHALYLENALKAYRNGERKNAQMNVVAATLSDEDIADLAAYYESLGVEESPDEG